VVGDGLDPRLGFPQRVEDLAVQQLIAQLAVERFIVAIFPWAAGFDEQHLHTDPAKPVAHHLRHELRPIAHREA
jgi:hypothetical protein